MALKALRRAAWLAAWLCASLLCAVKSALEACGEELALCFDAKEEHYWK